MQTPKNPHPRSAFLLAALLATPVAWSADWLAQIGGLGAEVVFDLVETPDERLCATGTFSNDATFGKGERAVELHADDIQDVFVACYDRDGQLEFAVPFGATITDQPRALAALPGGDILVTGYFTREFGAGKSAELSSDGDVDIFLVRLDREGRQVWSKRLGGDFGDNGNAVAVAENGDILLAGSFEGTIFYEREGRTHKVASYGGRDAVLFRLDPQGNVRWARSFGGTGLDTASRVATLPDGGVIVGGTFEGHAQYFGDGTSITAEGGSDLFVAAFDIDGRRAWSSTSGGEYREYLSGLAADAQGNVYLSANFQGELRLPYGRFVESAGSTDVLLLSLDAAGKPRWHRRLGGEGVDESFDLSLDGSERLLVSGHFQDDVELATDTGPRMLRPSGKGNADGFVMTWGTDGKLHDVLTAAGEGVETAFTVAALQNGGIAAGGFFNREVALGHDATAKLRKRGKTDIFIARLEAASRRQNVARAIDEPQAD